jgi:hypothetical protein
LDCDLHAELLNDDGDELDVEDWRELLLCNNGNVANQANHILVERIRNRPTNCSKLLNITDLLQVSMHDSPNDLKLIAASTLMGHLPLLEVPIASHVDSQLNILQSMLISTRKLYFK